MLVSGFGNNRVVELVPLLHLRTDEDVVVPGVAAGASVDQHGEELVGVLLGGALLDVL